MLSSFVKNIGQFHPCVAYVAKVTNFTAYDGVGVVILSPNMDSFEYTQNTPDGWQADDEHTYPLPAEMDAAFPGKLHAIISCGEIVIDHGTSASAYLNLTRG